jgi:hypothetical protein
MEIAVNKKRRSQRRHTPIKQAHAVVAQLVEHFHGKEEVTGSIPVNGSTTQKSERIHGSLYDRLLVMIMVGGAMRRRVAKQTADRERSEESRAKLDERNAVR